MIMQARCCFGFLKASVEELFAEKFDELFEYEFGEGLDYMKTLDYMYDYDDAYEDDYLEL
jgi:hypothetical protein